MGRKTVHRGRLCLIRAATRPRAALSEVRARYRWRTTYLAQSCAGAGCGANQAQAPAVGDRATEHGYGSARSARTEPGVRLMLASLV